MTEEDIIKLIRTGGKAMDAGVKALYETKAQAMLRFFVYKGTSGDEAKDILQETFINIARSADSYNGIGEAKSWMWQIARNCLINYQRKEGSRGKNETPMNDEQWKTLEETTPDPNATSCYDSGSADECVRAGLEKFSRHEPERAFVLMLKMDGMRIEEIGHRIDRTMAGTKQYLYECRKKIKPYIAQCFDLLPA